MWGSSVVLVALFSFIVSYHEAEGMDKNCLTAMSKMMDNNKKLIVPCIEKMGLSTGAEKKEKALCIMKCVMIEGKMLGADGSVDMELAQKILDDLPDALKEKAGDVIQECGHHAAGFDPSEASCESYREFVSCMLDVSMKMCN
ncbi:unnamed protein product [Orchesella dallaii]|uniref:Uncharacterized protein n=1 Tax=Orchesella dallaii TaxID=48710 RepID=A0ABP1Q5J9_9HEXA